ncbi:MAG: 30S ribosomal protein S4 [Planctomycetes bacterium]|nr:30S ribosomal protein S4 [Planctomycetota bacterium]
MARLIGVKCRRCRTEGAKLFLKGQRCETMRCPIEKEIPRPGQHGAKRRRTTDYGSHLREKQKLKRLYGLTERQFKRYFYDAQRMPGNTGENLLILLERRLDNILFYGGWTGSRSQSRQFISHGHIDVNGKRVNIASYLADAGDVISVHQRKNSQKTITQWHAQTKRDTLPSWLKPQEEPLRLQIVQLPKREDITVPVNEQLIVEFATR